MGAVSVAGLGRIFLCLALSAAVMLMGSGAAAAWWLEAERFHASVHGKMACRDCHIPAAMHPDPRRVAISPGGAFDPEACYACHAAVKADLERQQHGGEAVTDPKEHADCRRCHDVHVSSSASAREGGFDPGLPVRDQCGACHAAEKELPAAAADDAACMACHRRPQPGNPTETARVESLCLECHGNSGTPQQGLTGQRVPLIDRTGERPNGHAALACTECHTQAAAYGHADQTVIACTQCHTRHDEKKAHDAHLAVSCEACHLKGGSPAKTAAGHTVVWRATRDLGVPLGAHALVDFGDRRECRRCHFEGNTLGAAAMVLPAKSLICLPCHAGTLSAADPTSWISLSLLAAGFLLGGLLVFGGGSGTRAAGPIPSTPRPAFSLSGLAAAVKAVFLDVLLQRRLFRRSPKRWLVHGLLFYPMLLRTLWGVLALLASLAAPGWPPTWVLLDKNHPAAEAVFDATGLMLLAGVALLIRRGRREAREGLAESLPAQDTPALVGIAFVVVIGFVLEGLRMAMTGAGSPAAFVGFALAALFSGAAWLTEAYGYVWYAHAVGVGALVAYLPFSRLKHMILSPVVIALNALERGHRTP